MRSSSKQAYSKQEEERGPRILEILSEILDAKQVNQNINSRIDKVIVRSQASRIALYEDNSSKKIINTKFGLKQTDSELNLAYNKQPWRGSGNFDFSLAETSATKKRPKSTCTSRGLSCFS